jgi:hypothetical protein
MATDGHVPREGRVRLPAFPGASRGKTPPNLKFPGRPSEFARSINHLGWIPGLVF